MIEGHCENIHTCLAPSSSATARARSAGASDRSKAVAKARAPYLPSVGPKPGVPAAKPINSVTGPLLARSHACRRSGSDQSQGTGRSRASASGSRVRVWATVCVTM